MAPDSKDDIGFDEHGRPFMFGAAARAEQSRIVDDPNAKPILVIATLNGEIGVRSYGPPSLEVADLLDHVAGLYRESVNASLKRRQ